MKKKCTNLYLYHNDNNFGLRVLHLLYNKAHIGCSSGRDEAEKRKLRRNIVRVRYMIDMTRGMFYMLALVDRSTAY